MLLIPAVCFALFFACGFSGMAAGVVLLLEACPSAAITSVFAVQYSYDEEFAAGSVVITTLLSIVILAGMRHASAGNVENCGKKPYGSYIAGRSHMAEEPGDGMGRQAG